MDPTALAVVAVGFSVFALAVVLAVAVRVGRLLRSYDSLVAGEDGASVSQALGRQTAMAQGLRRDVMALAGDVETTRAGLAGALRHVAVVRYAGDVDGQQSFSAALLDDGGDGLVLTSLSGRTGTRTTATCVSAGAGERDLSPEEAEAVQRAGAVGRTST